MTLRSVPFRLLALFASLLPLAVAAHEYWLEPEQFMLPADNPLRVDIRIGQHFKGDSFTYIPDQVESLQLHRGDASRRITPTMGDFPAIITQSLGDGLHILTLSSSLFSLTYYEPETFPNFVRKEGHPWAIEQHKKRGLPETGFTEGYRRHAKSLIRVGDGQGNDRRTGLTFEWVLQGNPYTEQGPLVAQLWWHDQVLPDAPCRLFVRQDGRVQEHVLRTDEGGRVTLPHSAGAVYLLNAVQLTLPEQATLANTRAVWESHWASLTFATP